MTPERKAKFESVVAHRQGNLTVILENVHDPHNIGAVLRSCDSIGIQEIFVLYSEEQLALKHFEIGKSSSSGARKWVDVHFFTDPEACFAKVREKYKTIYSTHLSEDAKDLYELDLCGSLALLFGNERDGLSEAALAFSDGNFIIPQVGMVESLNISVACAVSLYEVFRQRRAKGMYEKNLTTDQGSKQSLLEDFHKRHEQALKSRKAYKLSQRKK